MTTKYPVIDEPVFITGLKESRTIHGGGVLYQLVMQGLKTESNYICWIEPGMMNWRNWKEIVHYANTKGQVLTNLKFKDKAKNLVNADSEVTCNYRVSQKELADIVSEYQSSQTQFGKLFE